MTKTALLFGSTGFVGSYLLNDLLFDDAYKQIVAVSRRPLDITHPKLKVVLSDSHSLSSVKDQLVGNDIFIALGTTNAATPDREKYYQIDHDYPVLAGKIAKENGAQNIFVVSAVGANAKSKLFYVRTKGEMERDILALNFAHTHIFQPSMILGSRKEHRPLERLFTKLWPAIDPLLFGPLSKYRGVEAKLIAQAMHRSAQRSPSAAVNYYHWSEMNALNSVSN